MTMEPFRILIVLSTTRWSRHLGEVAVREATDAMKTERRVLIDALYIVEQDDINRIVHRAGDKGFLSDAAQDTLVSTLLSEHDRVAQRRRQRLADAVKNIDATITWEQVKGDYEAEVRRAVQSGPHDVIVLVQSKRSFLERLFQPADCAEDDRVARWAKDESGTRVLIEEGV
jgi:hypothetical protein